MLTKNWLTRAWIWFVHTVVVFFDITNHCHYRRERFAYSTFVERHFVGIEFEECHFYKDQFVRCTFEKCTWLTSDFEEVTFVECDFLNCRLRNQDPFLPGVQSRYVAVLNYP